MKKTSFLFLICILLSTGLYANPAGENALKFGTLLPKLWESIRAKTSNAEVKDVSQMSPRQIRQALRKDARNALRQAREVRKTIPEDKNPPMYPVSKVKQLRPSIYPLIEEVNAVMTSDTNIKNYLIAQENLLYAQEIQRLQTQVWPLWETNLPLLKQIAAQTQEPADPLAFAAQHIPAQAKIVAIGESHLKSTRLLFKRFLPLVHPASSEEQAILLTEFLFEGYEYKGDLQNASRNGITPPGAVLPELIDIWETALANNIRVIGMDQPEAYADSTSGEYKGPCFEIDDINFIGFYPPVPASLQGIKWRNEKMANTIKKYRQLYPNARLFLYTGSFHVDYGTFHSLTANEDPQTTFVIFMLATRDQMLAKYSYDLMDVLQYYFDPLGAAMNGLETFDQPFLYWADPQLAHIAGFDMSIQAKDRFLNPGESTQ